MSVHNGIYIYIYIYIYIRYTVAAGLGNKKDKLSFLAPNISSFNKRSVESDNWQMQ
jgi:hypothetical protein